MEYYDVFKYAFGKHPKFNQLYYVIFYNGLDSETLKRNSIEK